MISKQLFKESFPELTHLLVVTFHEDWRCDYQTPMEALRDFLEQEGVDRSVVACRDIERLLRMQMDERELDQLLLTVGCSHDYSREGETALTWLAKIRDHLQSMVSSIGQ